MNSKNRFGKALKGLIPPILLAAYGKLSNRAQTSQQRQAIAAYTRLHLACGTNIMNGWANIDLSGNKEVIYWDLTRPLPVDSGSMELVYCEHFIEHISREQARNLLAECHRVLKPGGVLRVSTPSLRKLIEEYLSGELSEWSDVGWKPATPCQMMNEGFRLWGHQFIYDADELKRIFEEAGWHNLTQVEWGKSAHQGLNALECRPFHGEIIMEGVK